MTARVVGAIYWQALRLVAQKNSISFSSWEDS